MTIALRSTIPTEHEMMVYNTMAKQAVTSKMYRGIGEESAVMMIMLAARELGVSPMMALNGGLNIINGKVEISARIMSALIRQRGHHIVIDQSDENVCILTGKRSDTNETTQISFTIKEAHQAGLIKSGGGWTKFPKDMLFARALSRLARQLFSDVVGISYVEGEIRQESEKIIRVEDIMLYDSMDQEKKLIDQYLDEFSPEEKTDAENYLNVVISHFGWTQQRAIQELLKDKEKLKTKFNGWKQKVIPLETK